MTTTRWKGRLAAALADAESDDHAIRIQRHYRGHANRQRAARRAAAVQAAEDGLAAAEAQEEEQRRKLEHYTLAELRRQAENVQQIERLWLAEALAEGKDAVISLLLAAAPQQGPPRQFPDQGRSKYVIATMAAREHWVLKVVAELNPELEMDRASAADLRRLNR